MRSTWIIIIARFASFALATTNAFYGTYDAFSLPYIHAICE